jgi:hypothetical protein
VRQKARLGPLTKRKGGWLTVLEGLVHSFLVLGLVAAAHYQEEVAHFKAAGSGNTALRF